MAPCLALIALAIAGCAASPRVAEGEPPADFSIDLTVLVGTAAATLDVDEPQPHHLRQSRYVLFPDGRLHHGSDPRRGAEWLPPAVRTLDSTSIQQVWSLAKDMTFADPAAGDEPFNFKLVTAAPGEVVYLMAVTGDKQRWAVTRSSRMVNPDANMSRFINHLAELAWVEDPAEPLRPLPPRYDFGPDPYERYR